MVNAVKKFLALHHHLSLPGIGNFTVETKPAQIDFTGRTIQPYYSKINFSNEALPASRQLLSFLSQQLTISETEAGKKFTAFTNALKETLNEEKIISLNGIGKIVKEQTKFNFLADELPLYFPQLTAERIIRKNATHLVRVGEEERTSEEMHTVLNQTTEVIKERWWIPATILAVVGIAAIVFYYTFYTRLR